MNSNIPTTRLRRSNRSANGPDSQRRGQKADQGGIQLPDNIEIPTITGRIVSVSAEIEMSSEFPLKQYDKVLFNPKGAIPVDFEGDNRLFVVEVENVVAVFRKQ